MRYGVRYLVAEHGQVVKRVNRSSYDDAGSTRGASTATAAATPNAITGAAASSTVTMTSISVVRP